MVSTLIAFALYIVAVVSIGVIATTRSQETGEDIHLGSRDHGIWTSALSSSASTESGFVLLGMVGMGYSAGISAFWMIPAGLLGYALNWFVLAPKLRKKSAVLDAVTVPEFITASTGNTRLSRFAGGMAGLFMMIFLLVYVSAQFTAAGKAISSQFPVGYSTGVLLTSGLVGLYAVLGGFRAVSWTDNLQAVMMVFALVVLPLILVTDIGGIPALIGILAEKDPSLVSITGGAQTVSEALLVIVPWLMIGLAYPGQAHGIARLMAVRDKSVFRSAPYIAMFWLVVVYAGAVLLGLAARAGFEGVAAITEDPETALPVLAVTVLPGFLAGVTLAAIIAAISSTADSQLIASSSTLVRDIRAALGLREFRHELRITRIAIVILTIVSMYFAVGQTQMVFKFVLYAFFGLGASIGPALLYCAHSKKPNPSIALSGIVAGGIATFIFARHPLSFIVSASVAVVSMILASLFTRTQSSV